ncbi:dUTP diphosphatase [Chlamydia suis]|uniref:dUTP diphosphatase n=1 Tax=Chlamydia suis TaxID=83559 RepID=UPI0009E1A2C9|nr:dUTP diphosphatase [Chlamydia suis]
MKFFCKLDSGSSLPEYATVGASGADVRANISEPIAILPGQRALIPTGVSVDIPQGYEIQVRSRSGLAAKYGVIVLQSPGTIDADYRGEIRVILANFGEATFIVEPGMRIAQLVVAKVEQVSFVKTNEELPATARGTGGFGHTGEC